MTDVTTTEVTTPVATPARPGVKRIVGVDFDFGSLRTAGPRYWGFVGLLSVIVVMGVIAFLLLTQRWGAVVAMRDTYPWGLWFINYMYFVGLSAGGLAVYASVHLFGAKQFEPLARFAVLQAGVLVMCALMGIASEIPGPMARPERMLQFFTRPNITSPFVYTGSAATIYFFICFFDLWVMITGKGGHKLAFRMTLIALPFAIYLHTTTAFVLALNKSRELWHAAVMVPIFLTSATASGIALLIIFAYIVQATTDVKFKPSMFRSLSTFLATVMIIDLFLLVVEIITIYWKTSAMPGHYLRFNAFLFGNYAWAFVPVLVLGFTAFGILARQKTRHIPAVQLTAAGLYVFAVFLKRYSLDAMGFVRTTLGQVTGNYWPSLTEVMLALGILAFGILFVTLAVRVLPLEMPEEDEHEAEHAEISAEPALEAR